MRRSLARGVVLWLLPLALLAGCGDDTPAASPEAFPPLTYDYLTKIRLNVATITVDDSWTPADGTGQHVEYLSPVQPLDALRQMAHDRLEAAGTTGQAKFVIEDASIVQEAGRLSGSLAVRLDVSTSDGLRSGFAEARVTRSTVGADQSADGGRAAAYQLTKQMMDDMNVEFEYQVRHTLRDYVEVPSDQSPTPAPVQSQDLGPPGAVPVPAAAPLPAPLGTPPEEPAAPNGPTPLAPP